MAGTTPPTSTCPSSISCGRRAGKTAPCGATKRTVSSPIPPRSIVCGAGHADDPVLLGAAQRVTQRRGADEFEYLVDPAWKDLLHLLRDRTGIDEYLVGAA